MLLIWFSSSAFIANPISSKTSRSPLLVHSNLRSKPKYLVVVEAFLYLATFTTPVISLAMSVLARHSQKPIARHWARVKHLFRYLRRTQDLGLLYTKEGKATLKGYVDAGYKFDTKSGKSQSGYIFLRVGAPVSWKSVKQTIIATSTNHSELIAFHEATRKLVWLRKVHRIIIEQASLELGHEPTILHEDNFACKNQLNASFIKADWTKHVDQQIYRYTQDLIEDGQLTVRKVKSAHNVANMFIKALPAYTHKRLVYAAGMRSY